MRARSTQNLNCGAFLWGRECQTFIYSSASAGKPVRMQNTAYRSSDEILPGTYKVLCQKMNY